MPYPLAISSYSFHRFGSGPEGSACPSFAEMLRTCARYGVEGIELLGVHFERAAPPTLAELRRLSEETGVRIVAISAHHNFAVPDPERRREQLAILTHWIDVAAELGAPYVRAFGGRWATIRNFAEFMAARGEEPPLPGYRDEEGYAWVIEAFRAAAAHAAARGVTIALENHWGFTGTAAGVLRILEGTASPWLKAVLDTGNFNFCPDPYAEMAAIAPHAVMVHAKTYIGGGIYYTADLDYDRIARILARAGFDGPISLEFEGKAHPEVGIPASLAMLRAAFA